jgi:hypothetical protein
MMCYYIPEVKLNLMWRSNVTISRPQNCGRLTAGKGSPVCCMGGFVGLKPF